MATKSAAEGHIRLPKGEYTPKLKRKYNGIEADPKLRAYCLNILRNRPDASEYKEQLFRREPLGRRVIQISAKEEGNCSNEQKKGLNDESEVTSHTSVRILEQPQE